MHRVESRTYVGNPNETVTVNTQASGGGVSNVILNNTPVGPSARVTLPATPGALFTFQVQLTGPLGATCVVSIATVDGGSDGDFLMCQAHNPSPVNTYSCSVVAVPALMAFAAMRAAATPTPPTTLAKAHKKPATKKAKKKMKTSGEKTSKKKVGGK